MKCDELKPLVFSISDLAYVDEPTPQPNFQNPHDHAVYKATEVDAAIAELKDEQLAATRHQKYKRCLEIAKRCGIGAQFQHNNAMQFDNPFYIKRAEWLEKWHKRWLELAEKFKPNKEEDYAE